jgi:fumarate hydratase subunit beta
MSKVYNLTTPVSTEQVKQLRCSDVVFLSGSVFTARDLAHNRIMQYLKEGKKIEFDLKGQAVWHCGPIAHQKDGVWHIDTAGPTSSTRLTNETPSMIRDMGVKLVIGKGSMGKPAVDAMVEHGAAFLAATGGCGAVYAKQIKKVNNVTWLNELGLPEAVWEFKVENFGGLIVAIDSVGNNLYRDVMINAACTIEDAYKSFGIENIHQWMIHWPPAVSGTDIDNIKAACARVGGA